MGAIYKRELRSYFNGMTGWVFVAVLTAFTGIYFMVYNLYGGFPYFSAALGSLLFVLMLLTPLLTMRSLAEERRSRTDQLLLTAPVGVWAVVLGKYFAMLTVLAAPMAIACLCPLIIKMGGTAYLAADYAAILAFFLLGAVEIAVGLLVSALTVSQVIAAAGTLAVLLVGYLWDGLVGYLPVNALGSLLGFAVIWLGVCALVNALADNWAVTGGALVLGLGGLLGGYAYDSEAFAGLLPELLGRFSLLDALDSFTVDHVLDLSGLLLYLSLSALLVFLTVQVIQRRRWN